MENVIVDQNNMEIDKFILHNMRTGKSSSMIKKRIGKSIITIVLAAFTLIPTVNAANINNISTNSISTNQLGNYTRLFISEDELLKRSNPLLDKVISSNKNIDNFEKGVMAQFKSFIDDNPYITEKNYENFKTVKIKYVTGKSYSAYFQGTNEIEMSSRNDELLFHELLHCFSSMGFMQWKDRTIKISYEVTRKLNEGMTEMTTCEYTTRPKTMYYYEQLYMKMIIELVGKDVVLDAYTNNKLPIIIDSLAHDLEGFENSISAQDSAVHFLNTLSRYFDVFNGNFNQLTKEDAKELKTILQKYLNYIYNKKNKSFSSDLKMKHYFESLDSIGTVIYTGKKYDYTFEYDVSNYYNNVKESKITIKYTEKGGNEYKVLGVYNLSDIEKNYFEFLGSLQNDELIDQSEEIVRQR